MSKLFPRLLGALGVHAAVAALFWALTRFYLVREDALSTDLLTRLDGDPVRAGAYVAEATGDVLLAGLGGLLVSAVLACLWLVMIHRNPPYGDESARAKRTSWAGFMLLALLVTLAFFWLRLLGSPIAELLASNVPPVATAIGLVLVALAYWLGTAIFVPLSTKVAVPGAAMFGR